jgi:hypothetical protein
MDSHIYGFALQELNHPFEPQQYPEVAETYLPQLPPGQYPTWSSWPSTSWKATTTASPTSPSAWT